LIIDFEHISTTATLGFLNELQNNIRIFEYKIFIFCNQQVGNGGGDWFTNFEPLIGQSSTILKVGEQLEVSAGVGAFTPYSNPKIFINNKQCFINDSGFVRYVTTTLKEGNHSIPIKIEYTDIRGNTMIVDKKINYTVVKE